MCGYEAVPTKINNKQNWNVVVWVVNVCISDAWYGKIVKYHDIQHNVYINL